MKNFVVGGDFFIVNVNKTVDVKKLKRKPPHHCFGLKPKEGVGGFLISAASSLGFGQNSL